MIFDKNQKEFPSQEHNAIWNLGIHILPIEHTLPPEVKEKLPQYLVESCEQMQRFLLHYLGDMYVNIDLYLPLPYQLSRKMLRPFIDFGLLGEADEDSLTINRFAFDKFIKKLKNNIDYEDDRKAKVSFEYRIKTLERIGLKIKYSDNSVTITNELYPNMFYAMREMAQITVKEKASMDNSFTYCDFRKLCKDYKYDRYANALVFLSDEQREIAEKLDFIAKKYKMTRSVNSGHCAGYGIIYSYKKKNIMQVGCLRNQILMHVFPPFDKDNPESTNDMFYKYVENDSYELKKFFLKNLQRCRWCKPNLPCQRRVRIFGMPQLLHFSVIL